MNMWEKEGGGAKLIIHFQGFQNQLSLGGGIINEFNVSIAKYIFLHHFICNDIFLNLLFIFTMFLKKLFVGQFE